ncbi:hypothetical protein [Streptomyces stelliscabiei]|uniref:hypothetical protein n=1 Tax=Streptomyces stelliscabiei TaxID=146820 RepID=UPI003A8D40C8
MRDVHEDLRARLRESAEAHEPDRARILARIERGMAAPEERRSRKATRPPLWGWVRVVTATAGVASVLAVGGYAVASAVKGEETAPADRGTVVVSPTPVDSPAATSRAPIPPDRPSPSAGGKQETKPRSTPSQSPSAKDTTAPTLPSSGDERDGPLWSDGSVDPHSNDFWAQSNLTLKTSEHSYRADRAAADRPDARGPSDRALGARWPSELRPRRRHGRRFLVYSGCSSAAVRVPKAIRLRRQYRPTG